MKLSHHTCIAGLGVGHAFIHVASFGLDDLFIIICIGVYLCLRAFR